MHAYTVNRDDRPDRWEIYQQVMCEMGFEKNELHRFSAYCVEDYETRADMCDQAAKDFPEYFNFHRDKKWPSYGLVLVTWCWMHVLKKVSEMDVDFVFMAPDDYAFKRPKARVVDLCEKLGDVKILQLAYHKCDFVHSHVKRDHQIILPYRMQSPKRAGNLPVWKGMGLGSADVFVASPQGAKELLDYMCESPSVNFENVLYAFHHEKAPTGTYSVIENNIGENGNVLMQKNAWIQHLIDRTDGKVSDLDEYYSVSSADWYNKPKVREKDAWE